MIVQIFLVAIMLALAIWGLEISPLPAFPKRLAMAAIVLGAAYSLAAQTGILQGLP